MTAILFNVVSCLYCSSDIYYSNKVYILIYLIMTILYLKRHNIVNKMNIKKLKREANG